MPFDRDGEWYDDPNEVYDGPMSPFEQAQGEYWTPDSSLTGVPQENIDLYESQGMVWPGDLSAMQEPEPTPDTPPAPSPNTGGGDLGSLLQPYGGTFQRPNFGDAFKQAVGLLGPVPTYTPPAIPQIDPFVAPTWDDVMADPSYMGRKNEGEQALKNYRAAQGLARTGGTLKDLLEYNQDFASREYGNVWNRGYQGWQGNVDATLRRSGLEQEQARDVYAPQLFEWDKKADVGMRAEELDYDRAFNEFLTDYNMWRNHQGDSFDRLRYLNDFDLGAA